MSTKNTYEVNVGNIGNIPCANLKEANKTYNEYVRQSKMNNTRANGESVTLLANNKPVREFIGEIDTYNTGNN